MRQDLRVQRFVYFTVVGRQRRILESMEIRVSMDYVVAFVGVVFVRVWMLVGLSATQRWWYR